MMFIQNLGGILLRSTALLSYSAWPLVQSIISVSQRKIFQGVQLLFLNAEGGGELLLLLRLEVLAVGVSSIYPMY